MTPERFKPEEKILLSLAAELGILDVGEFVLVSESAPVIEPQPSERILDKSFSQLT